jgi:choline dehydrogenase-like flavoprotein
MLPREDNCVTLNLISKDRWGIPIPRISSTFSDNEIEMVADQTQQLSKMVEAAGYDIVWTGKLSTPGASMHEVGTARMGFDRRSSVLNPYNQCWDAPNLFVTDGAAFTSAGFQNPTLTMMAITGRACHFIAGELSRNGFNNE